MANDVTFNLELATKEYNKSLQQANSNMGKFTNSFEKASKGMSSAWASFAGNLGANVVAAAGAGLANLVSSMGDIGRQAIENAKIQEDAINDLNIALKGTGTFSKAASKDMQAFASELQKTSTFGDEALLKTAALGAQMAKLSGQDLKDATAAAANMAAALNVDLNTAMTLIAKSSTDGGSGLKRYGIVVSKGADSSETLANAIASVNEKFSGAAAGKIKTYGGAVQQASNSYGDMLEEIGNVVTQSPAVISIINIASQAFTRLGTFISDNKERIQGFVANGIVKLLDGLSYIVDFINPVLSGFRTLTNFTQILWNTFTLAISGITGIWLAFQESWLTGIETIVRALPQSLIPEGMLETILEAKELIGAVTTELAEQVNTDMSDIQRDFNDVGDAFVGTVSDDKIKKIKKGLTDTQKFIIKNAKDTTKALKDNNKEGLADSLKTNKEKTAYEKATDDERIANRKSTFGTIATLSQSNNKTLAGIGKAAAITTATIDGYAAVQKALASAPPPFNFILAGLVGAATTANVAKIAGVNFEHGGVVPGSSFTGDSVSANLNSGEMVLNRGQQSQLFSMANNGGGNSDGVVSAINALGDRIANMEIVLQADDNEIARSTSRGVEQGIIIGRS